MEAQGNDFQLGGRLRFFKTKWAIASKWQQNVICRGLRVKFPRNPPTLKPASLPVHYSLGAEALLRKFQLQGVIVPCPNPLFLSRVFTVPKQNGQERLILDLSRLNVFLDPPSFFLPSLRTLKEILPAGSWMGKIDLTDAYLHVPVNQEFQRYLAFPWGNQIFMFSCLPFGLCLAPAVFQGLINFPVRIFRAKGILCLAYLDDLIVFASSKAQCQKDLDFAKRTLFLQCFWHGKG